MLRIDDIQRQAVDDIHAFGVIERRGVPTAISHKSLQSPRFYAILIPERRWEDEQFNAT